MKPRNIAAIGAGGKTAALRLLARRGGEMATLFTTTTHIFPLSPPECRVCLTDPTGAELAAALSQRGVVCAGSAAKEGKLGILPPDVLTTGLGAAQLVLYEGDGSHHLPLKFHRPDEPVLLPNTHRCLVVAGLSALGRPVDQAVHRHTLLPQWEKAPHTVVGPEEFLTCVLETLRAAGLPRERFRVLLNQLDTQKDPRPAVQLVERLQAEGLNTRAGSLEQAPPWFYDWVMG